MSSPAAGGQDSPSSTTSIRYAGRVHIRGKIRRIWRPRYLEVLDSGLVRYYEITPHADLMTLPEDSDWEPVNMIPRDNLTILNARLIDVTSLRDLHVGLPKESYGFLFRGQRVMEASDLSLPTTCGPPEPVMPRDYFCAVSSLLEAQQWVVALHWATTRRRGHYPYRLGPSPHSKSISPGVASNVSSFSFEEGESSSATRSTPFVKIRSPSERAVTPPPVPPPKERVSSTIIVTKAHQCLFVRTSDWNMDIAYKIQVLLVQQKPGNLTKVVERHIWRSTTNLEQLLTLLQSELKGKSSTHRCHQIIRKVNDMIVNTPRMGRRGSKRFRVAQLRKSIEIVDKSIRLLGMESAIVNSRSLRKWFAFDKSTSTPPEAIDRSQSVGQWDFFKKCHEDSNFCNLRSLDQIPDGMTVNEFVKDWLDARTVTRETPDAWVVWLVQTSRMALASFVVLLVALCVPLFRTYERMMGKANIRIDLLVLSWGASFLVGRATAKKTGAPAKQVKRSNSHDTSARVPTLSQGPVGQSELISESAKSPNKPAPAALEFDSDDSEAVDDPLNEEGGSLVDDASELLEPSRLSSPLPKYPENGGSSCWSIPSHEIFRVRGASYLDDRIKVPSGPTPFVCRGVDVWLTENPQLHIARHPSILGGKLKGEDTFMVNFLLPFGNFVSYFTVPPRDRFPPKLALVWDKFLNGDQAVRDARLKLLPVVVDGPWIVRAAVGNGSAPALLGKVIPLQYFFRQPTPQNRGVYEVDVIITASSIAKGILSVVKGHTKSLSIAFAFIIEAAELDELPETVLCAFQVHGLHLEDCPQLPDCDLDAL